jgi:hypothetical protein
MDSDAFIRWALDNARTVEERYTTELIVEQGLNWWFMHHKISRPFDHAAIRERQRQRTLNPAYEPKLDESNVRRAAEMLHNLKTWNTWSYNERPIRDLKAFTFLTELEDLRLNNCEVTDLSVFATLPKLGVLHFASADCEDFSALAGCRQLRELGLTLGKSVFRVGTNWPNVQGLEQLEQLETLALSGNLLAFAPGVTWPKVRTATLNCDPLPHAKTLRATRLPSKTRSVLDCSSPLELCKFNSLAVATGLKGVAGRRKATTSRLNYTASRLYSCKNKF